eukprot:Platyproteum_vivax@DN6672_c0_g1_i2.p1
MYARQSNQPRGFGFIVFESAECAEMAIGLHQFKDRVVEAKVAEPPAARCGFTLPAIEPPPVAEGHPGRIFVGGLPMNLTEEEFRNYFEKFGPVRESCLMYDKASCRPRGFGFLVYEHPESAHIAIGHHTLNGRLVEVKHAEPRAGCEPPPEDFSPQGPFPDYNYEPMMAYRDETYTPSPLLPPVYSPSFYYPVYPDYYFQPYADAVPNMPTYSMHPRIIDVRSLMDSQGYAPVERGYDYPLWW